MGYISYDTATGLLNGYVVGLLSSRERKTYQKLVDKVLSSPESQIYFLSQAKHFNNRGNGRGRQTVPERSNTTLKQIYDKNGYTFDLKLMIARKFKTHGATIDWGLANFVGEELREVIYEATLSQSPARIGKLLLENPNLQWVDIIHYFTYTAVYGMVVPDDSSKDFVVNLPQHLRTVENISELLRNKENYKISSSVIIPVLRELKPEYDVFPDSWVEKITNV